MKLFEMCPDIRKYYLIVTVFGYLNGAIGISDNNCDKVKNEFRNIHLDDLVPARPIVDDRLKVCFKSLTVNQTSCCSHASEMKYTVAAEQHLKDAVHTQIEKLKSQVNDHMEDYEGKLVALTHYTLNRTMTRFSDRYDFPFMDQRHSVTQLFGDIEDFIKLKGVALTNSVSIFLDDIFPVILQKLLVQTQNSNLHNCLIKNRQEIAPNPFGKYPDKVAKKLTSGLLIARAYLEALEVVADALNTTDSLLYTEECIHAVTRMQYCSHCQGFVHIKPCKGFCLDVFRGCLSNLAEIGLEWNDIITSVEVLVREMSDKNLDDVFIELMDGIFEAVEHCEASFPEIHQKVVSVCHAHMEVHEKNSVTIPVRNPEQIMDMPSEVQGPLYIDVMKLTLNLTDSKGLFKHLADGICRQPKKFDQDVNSSTCWNGTKVAKYRRHPVNVDILSQVRNNPEVKVTLTLDPVIRNLKDKMSKTRLVLQTHIRKTERSRYQSYMISDDPDIEGSGHNGETPVGNVVKGDGTVIGPYDDDEDLYDNHMSGSGSGDNSNVDHKINIGNFGGNSDVGFPDGQSNGSPYEVDQGGNLGPDPPRTRRPPMQSENNQDKDIATVNVPSLLLPVLFLFIHRFIY